MTTPKSRYVGDPFLLALEDAPSHLLLTRAQAAGLLNVGLNTLDRLRARGYPPPAAILGKQIRYRLGDLRTFVDSLPTTKVSPLPPPDDDGITMIGMYDPIQRGGRRKKRVDSLVVSSALPTTEIRSFSEWLALGDPELPWRFLMLRVRYEDDFDSVVPIDLIASLGLELKDDDVVGWEELTLDGYAAAVRRHASQVDIAWKDAVLDRVVQPEGEETETPTEAERRL